MAIKIRINTNNEKEVIFWLVFLLAMFGAYTTHIVHCIAASKIVFLLVGAFIPPVAVIHGIGLWFGAW